MAKDTFRPPHAPAKCRLTQLCIEILGIQVVPKFIKVVMASGGAGEVLSPSLSPRSIGAFKHVGLIGPGSILKFGICWNPAFQQS